MRAALHAPAVDADAVLAVVVKQRPAAGIAAEHRVLARGEAPAAAKVVFRAPRERLYTNYGGIKLRLLKGGEVVDQRGECIFVAGNDRARLFTDFTPSMWPGNAPLDDIQALNLQLENIGIRSSFIPTGGQPAHGQYLACGLGVGGGGGEGSTFCGWPQKSNVRAQNFNTAKWRAEKPASVRKTTSKTAKFGLFQNVRRNWKF